MNYSNMLLSSLMFFLLGCGFGLEKDIQDRPVIIFETDVGNDVDDAMALDMIYKYLDQGKIDVLAIISNKDNEYSTEFIHLMNYWYGYPDLPIGKVVDGVDSDNVNDYSKYVSLLQDTNNRFLFERPFFERDSVPEAVTLYRKLLSEQPDKSVVIVSVGFSTNIFRLLYSTADNYSSLSGKDLIEQKVKYLSMMAGSFGKERVAEYNIFNDIPAAQAIVKDWPSPIVFTPFEAGISVLYPSQSIENDFNWVRYHPVVEAYKYYLKMPYDRPTWDLIALLYAVENNIEYFTETQKGTVSVNDEGFTDFIPEANGKHSFLKLDSTQALNVKERFVELITTKPNRYR